MAMIRILTLAITVLCLGLTASAGHAKPQCELDRPIRIAGLDWESSRFHVAVAQFIFENGYGCKSDVIPGSSIPLLAGMARGDLDVIMEVWKNNLTEAWRKAEKAGQVTILGINFPDAVQAWFVPRYLVEGENAPAKGLTHVRDLPKYKALFRDPEEPDKGRFYNCKLGWVCETVNTKKLQAYGLDDHFTNFRTGSSAALSAAIASAYARKKPIVYYYWGPSWIVGKFDAVTLKEPAYDEKIWAAMKTSENPQETTAYPLTKVFTGANTDFIKKAPKLTVFLRKYQTSNALVSNALVYLKDKKGARPKDVALHFLRTQKDIWQKWVPEMIAARVNAAL